MQNNKNCLWSVTVFILICIIVLTAGCMSRKDLKTSSAGYGQREAYSVTDQNGIRVSFADKPKRILTLSAYTDQIVLGLVNSDRMAAANQLLDDPQESNIIPISRRISRKIFNPGAEEVLALKPDIVIASDWIQQEKVNGMRDLGLQVVTVKGPQSIQDIKDVINQVATAIGEPEKGKDLVRLMDSKLMELKEKLADIKQKDRKKIVLLSLMTSYGGAGCTYDAACKEAKVINGIADAGLKNGQQLTKEMLLKINPEIILLPVYTAQGSYDTQGFIDDYIKDPSLQSVTAIKNKQLILPREQFIYNCSQDIVYCIAEIARCAYGKEFDFPDNAHLSVSGEKNE